MLIDIPRLKGVPYLEPGTAIYQEDVEAWEKMAGVKIESGDAILLRTGRWARREKLGPWTVGRNAAGFHASIVPFIKARGVAIVGSDAASDVTPTLVAGVICRCTRCSSPRSVSTFSTTRISKRSQRRRRKLKRWEFMIDDQPDADHGRHRIADEYDCDVLNRLAGTGQRASGLGATLATRNTRPGGRRRTCESGCRSSSPASPVART